MAEVFLIVEDCEDQITNTLSIGYASEEEAKVAIHTIVDYLNTQVADLSLYNFNETCATEDADKARWLRMQQNVCAETRAHVMKTWGFKTLSNFNRFAKFHASSYDIVKITIAD